MAVISERQSEMPLALRAVTGFFHGSEHHPVYDTFVRLALYVCYNICQSLGINIICTSLKLNAEVHKVGLQVHDFFRIGFFVNPVHERIIEPEKVFCHRFIGCKHEFLDEPVCRSSFLRRN